MSVPVLKKLPAELLLLFLPEAAEWIWGVIQNDAEAKKRAEYRAMRKAKRKAVKEAIGGD